MQRQADELAEEFRQSKKANTPLAFCLLMDEPAGQADSLLATDAASIERYQAWLKQLGKSPADSGVTDWEQVKPVVAAARDERPELHYYTQRFRTRSLGECNCRLCVGNPRSAGPGAAFAPAKPSRVGPPGVPAIEHTPIPVGLVPGEPL